MGFVWSKSKCLSGILSDSSYSTSIGDHNPRYHNSLFLAPFKRWAALIALAGHVVVVAGVAYAGMAKTGVKMEELVEVFLVTTPLNLVVSYLPREANARACVGVLLLHA